MPLLVRNSENEGISPLVRKYNLSLAEIYNFDNLKAASKKARKGKMKYSEVQLFNKYEIWNLLKIWFLLKYKKYRTGNYRIKIIFEPKKREIFILEYIHRVVQHALILKLEPIINSMLIKDTYSCIKGRGMHKASLRTIEFVRRNKYCLKMDIRKFYPSIDHNILYSMFVRKFKDKGLLWLIHDIIYSYPGGKNAPIGNLSSQIFGNFYMSSLDRYIKEDLGIKDYVRYCDDFLLFSDDKEKLRKAKFLIIEFLRKNLKLELSKADLFPVSRGVDFMGYRHFRDYLLLRKSTAKRIKKRIPKILRLYKNNKIPIDIFRSIIESHIGWASWANCHNFLKSTGLLEIKGEVMAKFSEIASENDKNLRKLEGESVKIEDWLEKPIKITAYRVEPSKFTDKTGKPKNRIGFEFYYEGVPRVIFTSAGTLIYLIQKYYSKDGLECKIVRRNGQLVLE